MESEFWSRYGLTAYPSSSPDPPLRQVKGYCSQCGSALYVGDECYEDIDGRLFCYWSDCLDDYYHDNKLIKMKTL